ncbi:hypothetical protein B586_20235 [Mycobacterium haemophilum DSM 44634]|nr:hypothetical protein B586_20235 [Mycobacterium haemophilum DSM 44634]
MDSHRSIEAAVDRPILRILTAKSQLSPHLRGDASQTRAEMSFPGDVRDVKITENRRRMAV